MKKLSVFGVVVLIYITMLSVVSPVWAYSDYWSVVKPYQDTVYDDEIGNSAVGDWGAISIGAHIVKYVDWGSGVNYDTLLVRFDVDVALKDDYREGADYCYFVRWVKLEFLETLNPDYTAIESHDFAAYNLKVQGIEEEYPESQTAVEVATELIGALPYVGMLLTATQIMQALDPAEGTQDDAERYQEGAQLIWLNPGFYKTTDQAMLANGSIKEGSGYCDVYWQVYDGTSYHEIQPKATVSYCQYDPWSYIEYHEQVETKVTLKFTSGGGGGGCPILSVYDGTGYVEDGLLDIHNPDGIDVVASHVLIHTPEPVEHRYLLRLTEHEQTHSHIDQVQLFATLKDGTETKLSLVSAVHSEDGDVLWELRLSDDVRADTLGADHNNGTSEWIDLEFVAPEGLEIEGFTFIIEGHNIVFKV